MLSSAPGKRFSILSRLKQFFLWIRKSMEKIRKKNPKLFDGFAVLIEIIWVLLSAFCTNLTNNAFFVAFMVVLACSIQYLFLWAKLTNKCERELEEERLNGSKQLSAAIVEKDKYIEHIIELDNKAMCFAHAVAHRIKTQISHMPYQKMFLVRNELTNFLTETLNTLEDILTERYHQKICASIKLCVQQNILKTYARGENNVENRGGKSKAKKLNKKQIHIDSNYAYLSIVQRQMSYFAEGDLHNLRDKENDDDCFFCEYGSNWSDMFNASIIIPIRYPVMTKQTSEFNVLGLICVDAKDPISEWSYDTSYAYQIIAYLADVIYNLIYQYVKKQAQSEALNAAKRTS